MIIGVIGSGTMGAGIAQVAATAGHQVILFDNNAQVLQQSEIKLQKVLARLAEKGKFSAEKSSGILNNINFVSTITEMAPVGLVIEAIIEDPDVKKLVFQDIEAVVDIDCIIASNTSSLSITSLAAALAKPERFVGIHFFNPAPLMKLVEIIPAIQSDQKTVTSARTIIESWQKSVVLAKDTPGFIVNRVARAFYGEAIRIYEEGIADIATIDWAMKTIGGFKMGPFQLMDFIGHDINYTVSETVFTAFFYDNRYKPSFTQKRLVEANYLGKKTGRGFYDYAEGSEVPMPVEDGQLGKLIVDRIVVRLINEAADAYYLNIANKEDIELAMTAGVNYPKGLLSWADEKGIDNCVEQLDELYDQYRESQYRCTILLRDMAKNNEKFFH